MRVFGIGVLALACACTHSERNGGGTPTRIELNDSIRDVREAAEGALVYLGFRMEKNEPALETTPRYSSEPLEWYMEAFRPHGVLFGSVNKMETVQLSFHTLPGSRTRVIVDTHRSFIGYFLQR